MCACVCVCVCEERKRERVREYTCTSISYLLYFCITILVAFEAGWEKSPKNKKLRLFKTDLKAGPFIFK